MWALVAPLKPYFKIRTKKTDHYQIDNWIFRLHYETTTNLFFLCTVLVTARQFFGDHIKCIVDIDDDFVKVVETYCFATYTFSVDKYHNASSDAIYAGIGPHREGDVIHKHGYYQWIPFVLFGQAIMFTITHWFWRTWEGGVMRKLASSFSKNLLKDIGKFPFLDCLKVRSTWGLMLVTLELLNLLNIILQIYLTDKFLDGKFLTYIPEIEKHGWSVTNKVFPKMSKCLFYKIGPSGTIQPHDALCILALNIIHEKIYAVLWVWLAALFVLTCLGLFWRLCTMIMYKKSRFFNRLVLGNFQRQKMHFYDLGNVIDAIGYSEWLFLKYLSKNMAAPKFEELILGSVGEASPEHVEFPSEDNEKGGHFNEFFFG